jgi:hypothetical protein
MKPPVQVFIVLEEMAKVDTGGLNKNTAVHSCPSISMNAGREQRRDDIVSHV